MKFECTKTSKYLVVYVDGEDGKFIPHDYIRKVGDKQHNLIACKLIEECHTEEDYKAVLSWYIL